LIRSEKEKKKADKRKKNQKKIKRKARTLQTYRHSGALANLQRSVASATNINRPFLHQRGL